MTIDHICFAVKDLREGIIYWTDVFGYVRYTDIVENRLQRVKVVFLSKQDSIMIKLIEPVQGNLSLINFVNRGGGFHHICFKCDDIGETMPELTSKGLVTLVAPQPGEAFSGHNIAFLLAKNGLNIELIDTNEKAAVIGLKNQGK